MNLVCLIGNLGADPEFRIVGDTSILKLRIATSEKWKNKDGEDQESTQWHSASIWGKRGEALGKILVKGDKVAVRGKIKYSTSEKDGVKSYFTDITVDDVELLGGKRMPAEKAPEAPAAARTPAGPPLSDDDIPF